MKMIIHPQDWSLYSIYRKFFPSTSKKLLNYIDEKIYATLPIQGKVVLDVGAYNGDSAEFFLKRGARKVIAIEINKAYSDQIHLANVEVINEPFRLEHLDLEYDVIKMDIEGFEALVLDYHKKLKPMVVEVHDRYLADRFKEIGFRLVYECPEMPHIGLMVNY